MGAAGEIRGQVGLPGRATVRQECLLPEALGIVYWRPEVAAKDGSEREYFMIIEHTLPVLN